MAIIAVTIGWGATFVMVQDAVELVTPLHFLAIRFFLSALVLAAIRPGDMRRAGRADIAGGAIAGVLLFGAYLGQTVGLQYATSSSVGLITGLYVTLVPLFAAVVLRRSPSAASLGGALLATAGLFLLSGASGIALGRGEWMAFGCAASFAVQILVVARFAPRVSPVPFTAVQMAVVGACSALLLPVAGPAGTLNARSVWLAIVFTAVVGGSIAFLVQTAAQRHVPPTRAAILFSMESVFAAVFGALLAGDRLGASGLAGGTLIIGGVLVTELLAPAREAA